MRTKIVVDYDYGESELTPEMEKTNRTRLGLPSKYVERLHVSGLLWKLKDHVKELTEAGMPPSPIDVLTWAEDALKKIAGKDEL